MEGQMKNRNLDKKVYLVLLCVILCFPGLASCGTIKAAAFEPVSTEVVKKEKPLNDVGVVEATSGPESLIYTNQTHGFEFKYPGSWTLTEDDHVVILIKDNNRIGIRFYGIDEDPDRFSDRTGIPAGELIYSDKICFMGRMIPVEVLVFQEKPKIVFYGGTGRIEIDDLVFSVTLDNQEIFNYEDVDLSEAIMTEAKSIVESFDRIYDGEKSYSRPNFPDTGLSAHLELSELILIGEEVNLKFTLTNESDTPLYFLKWYTPLEGIAGEIFKITRDGQAVPYEGILASRAIPSSDSYVLIHPGETVSAVVDLATSYNFSVAGTYQIGFISPQISHIAQSKDEMAKNKDDLGPVRILSNPVTLEIVDE
jgi:hypothetical protein